MSACLRSALLIGAAVAACGVAAAAGHPLRGETVVVAGTIQAIDGKRIQVETRDSTSFALTRTWLTTTEDTRYKQGRNLVDAEAPTLTPGERIVAVAAREHTDDYSLRFVALEIELHSGRRQHIELTTPAGDVLSIVVIERRRVPAKKRPETRSFPRVARDASTR
jgi:hypothetical protein